MNKSKFTVFLEKIFAYEPTKRFYLYLYGTIAVLLLIGLAVAYTEDRVWAYVWKGIVPLILSLGVLNLGVMLIINYLKHKEKQNGNG